MREVTYAIIEANHLGKKDHMVAVFGAPNSTKAVKKAVAIGIMPTAGCWLYALPESRWNKIDTEIAEGLCEWVKCPDCGDTMRRWELNITNHCAHGA